MQIVSQPEISYVPPDESGSALNVHQATAVQRVQAVQHALIMLCNQAEILGLARSPHTG